VYLLFSLIPGDQGDSLVLQDTWHGRMNYEFSQERLVSLECCFFISIKKEGSKQENFVRIIDNKNKMS